MLSCEFIKTINTRTKHMLRDKKQTGIQISEGTAESTATSVNKREEEYQTELNKPRLPSTIDQRKDTV